MPGISAVKTMIPFSKKGISWQAYWTPQYQDVLDAMTTEPSNDDKLQQAKLMKGLVDGGYFAKADLLDFFFVDSADNVRNWAAPATFVPEQVNSPVFEAYRGFTGNVAASRYLKLGFIPSTHCTKAAKDSITVFVGVSTDVNDNGYDFGVFDGTNQLSTILRWAGTKNFFINSNVSADLLNDNSIGHYSFSRSAATKVFNEKNLVREHASKTSTNLPTKELYACARNGNGTPNISGKQFMYVLIFSYLEDWERNNITVLLNDYTKAYGLDLLTATIAYTSNERTLAPLTTYVVGNDETIHPSVINAGLAINGFQYWMANTPFPSLLGGTPSDYENPSIWHSTDGLTWAIPAGLTNPIEAKPALSFNADVDIIYDNGLLYCFFSNGGTLVAKSSDDGVTWGVKSTITIDEANFLSPSVIKVGATFYCYYMKVDGGVYTVQRSSSNNILGPYAGQEEIEVLGAGALAHWHLDILYDSGTYWLMVINPGGIWIMTSSDGTHFTVNGYDPLLMNEKAFELPGFYRPSLMRLNSSELILYYVGFSGDGYQTAKVKVKILNI